MFEWYKGFVIHDRPDGVVVYGPKQKKSVAETVEAARRWVDANAEEYFMEEGGTNDEQSDAQ